MHLDSWEPAMDLLLQGNAHATSAATPVPRTVQCSHIQDAVT